MIILFKEYLFLCGIFLVILFKEGQRLEPKAHIEYLDYLYLTRTWQEIDKREREGTTG